MQAKLQKERQDKQYYTLIVLKKMSNFKIKKNKVYAEAGFNLFALNFVCLNNCLSGLEWSYGIPASIGGAIAMNAGAYGHEIKEFIK
ncbi:MAG: FAD-binding protein, partial [Bacteroidaceae bacterium]|nr:FAD-binding protein [Bacteroidaceae bacterium]